MCVCVVVVASAGSCPTIPFKKGPLGDGSMCVCNVFVHVCLLFNACMSFSRVSLQYACSVTASTFPHVFRYVTDCTFLMLALLPFFSYSMSYS